MKWVDVPRGHRDERIFEGIGHVNSDNGRRPAERVTGIEPA
jgi:hypothetical protein